MVTLFKSRNKIHRVVSVEQSSDDSFPWQTMACGAIAKTGSGSIGETLQQAIKAWFGRFNLDRCKLCFPKPLSSDPHVPTTTRNDL